MVFGAYALAEDTFLRLGAETSVPVPEGEVDVRMKVFVDHPVSEHFGIVANVLVSPTYAEVCVGPGFHIGHLSFDIGMGLETAEFPLRGATAVLWSSEHITTLGVFEYGGSGYWYKGLATYSLGPVSLGAFGQRFDGLGPVVDVETHHFDVWAAPVYDPEDTTTGVVAGLNWSL